MSGYFSFLSGSSFATLGSTGVAKQTLPEPTGGVFPGEASGGGPLFGQSFFSETAPSDGNRRTGEQFIDPAPLSGERGDQSPGMTLTKPDRSRDFEAEQSSQRESSSQAKRIEPLSGRVEIKSRESLSPETRRENLRSEKNGNLPPGDHSPGPSPGRESELFSQNTIKEIKTIQQSRSQKNSQEPRLSSQYISSLNPPPPIPKTATPRSSRRPFVSASPAPIRSEELLSHHADPLRAQTHGQTPEVRPAASYSAPPPLSPQAQQKEESRSRNPFEKEKALLERYLGELDKRRDEEDQTRKSPEPTPQILITRENELQIIREPVRAHPADREKMSRREHREVTLSIGSVELVVEGTPALQSVAPSRPVPVRAAAPESNTRLRRRFLAI